MTKQVLVIVGVGGMGEAIARRCGSGKHLLLADFNEELMERAAKALGGDGYDVSTHKVDVASKASVATLADAAAATGDVIGLAHTAGVANAEVERVLKIDLAGVAYSLEEFGRVVAPGGAGVVIASMAGHFARPKMPIELEGALGATPADQLLNLPFLNPAAFPNHGTAYAFAKRANQVRVAAAAGAWGARGARINSISPGIIATPMGNEELSGPEGERMRGMIAGSATKRMGTPGDIAAAAAFLLGSDSTFITGTDLLVDGGVVASILSPAKA